MEEELILIEQIVKDYLVSRNISGIGTNVFLEKPESKVQEYILIEKTGSGQTDKIDQALIAIQSISKNRMVNAAKTNERVKREMLQMADLDEHIYSCNLNSDYNFTNTATKEYRYQAVFNLHF